MTQQTNQQNWNLERLDSVCLVNAGSPAPQDEKYFENGSENFIRVRHLNELGKYPNESDKINELCLKENSVKKFPKDSLIFAKSGMSLHLNKRNKLKEDSYVVSHLAVLTPKKEKLNSDFLYYWSLLYRFSDLSRATNLPSMRLSDIQRVQIPLPPLPAQSQIVSAIESRFSKIDNAIKNLKSAKAKIQLYRKAVLKKAFEKGEDWEEKKIGEIVKVRYGKGLTGNTRNSNGKIPVYGSSGKIGHHNEFLIDFNTIVIARKGSVGNTFVVKEPCWPIDTAYYLENPQIDLDYLNYFLNLSIFKDTSTTIPSLRREDLESIKISFPPSLSSQQSIVSSIESKFSVIDKVEEIVDNSLKKAEKLKKSILKSAFEGRLVKE
jgi:type I restriction enzyme S subunit